MTGILLSIGGSNIKSNLSGTTATDGVNDFLINCGVAVGAIIIALASIKMVIALADESVIERQKAALLFGVGIVFISIDAVITTLIGSGINSSSSYTTVAQNVVGVIGSMASWSGAIMIVFGAFSYTMAIAQEDVGQNVKSISSLLVGIGFISIRYVCDALKIKIAGNVTTATSYVNIINGWLGSVATYGGGALAVMGIFKAIKSVKDEDTKGRNDSIKLLLVAIALLGFKVLLMIIGVL